MPYSCEAVWGNRISPSTFGQPDPKTSARISLCNRQLHKELASEGRFQRCSDSVGY